MIDRPHRLQVSRSYESTRRFTSGRFGAVGMGEGRYAIRSTDDYGALSYSLGADIP